MTADLRTKLGRAITAIAHDLKTDPDDGHLLLLDTEQLLDTVIRITDEHHSGTPLDQLGLTRRTENAIAALGIRSIEQLTARTRDEILNTRNMGQHGIRAIEEALAHRGLTLAEADPRQDHKTNSAAAGESGDPDPTAPADFFQAGRTYIQAKPYTPPENLTVFQCWSIATFPGTGEIAGEQLAFGFATAAHPGNHWSVYLCRRETWTEGWTEYDQTTAADTPKEA